MICSTALAKRLAITVLAAVLPFAAVAQGEDREIVINKVLLQVKALAEWVKSGGTLFRLTDEGRKHAADIDASGNLDNLVRCRKGDRFEATAESYFDRPTPPPRLFCGEELVFKFTRAVHNDWVRTSADSGIEPYVFSELSARTLQNGIFDASIAFSDAAIASTAKLLGDDKLDKFVTRDSGQGYKLVFNEAGLDALRAKQKSGGLRTTGQLDAHTQSLFAKELGITPGVPNVTTPAVSCGQKLGQLFCSSGQLPPTYGARVSLPSSEFKWR